MSLFHVLRPLRVTKIALLKFRTKDGKIIIANEFLFMEHDAHLSGERFQKVLTSLVIFTAFFKHLKVLRNKKNTLYNVSKGVARCSFQNVEAGR